MNNKHGTNTNKKLKQFSTKSRSKSAANFKGLNQLRRVLSHDGSYAVDDHTKERPGSMKKSKSSDSLHKRKAISSLSMTALGRTSSNSMSPHHDNWSNLSGPASGLKPLRGNSTKSVLELRDGDEMYNDHSTTDEEVEYFTDEEDKREGSSTNGRIEMLENDRVQKKSSHLSGADDIENERDSSSNSQVQELQGGMDDTSGSSSSEEEQTLLGTDAPSQSHNVSSDLRNSISRADSNNTLRNQLSYAVPSHQRPSSDDHISNVGSLPEQDQLTRNGHHSGREHLGNHISNDDRIDSADRIDQNGTEEDIINAPNNIETMANSLKRHGPTTNRTRNLAYADDNGDNASDDYEQDKGNRNGLRYSPTMILSQSTGIEKRFDRSPPLAEETGSRMLKNDGIQNTTNGAIPSNNNNFKYINSDFAASFNSNQGVQHLSESSVKPDFSTSISSLSSHLSRPTQLMTDNKAQKALHQRAGQNFATSHNNNRPQLNSRKSSSKRPDSLSNFNNFSQFLQTESNGTESRTQQKLWLQRENSLIDLSSQTPTLDTIFLASNIEVKREFERISREYTNVRRFSNPVTASLNRIAPRNRLDSKKNRLALSQTQELVKVFRKDGSQNQQSLQDFCKENLHLDIDIQRVLSTIWNKESAAFNRSSELPGQNDLNHTSSSHGMPLRSQTRNNLRTSYGSSNSINHQRGLGSGSLQPTTRAVHRRMESAFNQQQRL
ncbi:LAFA_0C02828g1_1 [Lachancea sp. 'fantastica']|nr:LAFA_0C02828g1_1 [Lachancea sp. 'fantastica']